MCGLLTFSIGASSVTKFDTTKIHFILVLNSEKTIKNHLSPKYTVAAPTPSTVVLIPKENLIREIGQVLRAH